MSRGDGSNTVNTVERQGVVKCRVNQLRVGQRCDLEADRFADEAYFDACENKEESPQLKSEHPEFQFEFETVEKVEYEGAHCIRVDFESGFSCGFPVDHEIGVDPEQDATLLAPEGEGEYEHDGQPDEVQEWHDFDPDC